MHRNIPVKLPLRSNLTPLVTITCLDLANVNSGRWTCLPQVAHTTLNPSIEMNVEMLSTLQKHCNVFCEIRSCFVRRGNNNTYIYILLNRRRFGSRFPPMLLLLKKLGRNFHQRKFHLFCRAEECYQSREDI